MAHAIELGTGIWRGGRDCAVVRTSSAALNRAQTGLGLNPRRELSPDVAVVIQWLAGLWRTAIDKWRGGRDGVRTRLEPTSANITAAFIAWDQGIPGFFINIERAIA